jgi:hypothetical protein
VKFVVKLIGVKNNCETHIREKNTKDIMSVKEFVYLIQYHADLHEL